MEMIYLSKLLYLIGCCLNTIKKCRILKYTKSSLPDNAGMKETGVKVQ